MHGTLKALKLNNDQMQKQNELMLTGLKIHVFVLGCHLQAHTYSGKHLTLSFRSLPESHVIRVWVDPAFLVRSNIYLQLILTL